MNGPQGCLYVYGGYDGHSVLADMYKLDLATRTWSLIWASKFSYGCGGSPVGVGGLRPVDFRIHPCRPAAVIGKSKRLGMYKLDLATSTWSLIWAPKFSHGCGGSPVGVGGLSPVDFRIHPCQPAAVIGKSKMAGYHISANSFLPLTVFAATIQFMR